MVTQGTKWVANKWINIDPDYQRQARYQQLVSQQPEDEDDEGLTLNPDIQSSDIHQDLQLINQISKNKTKKTTYPSSILCTTLATSSVASIETRFIQGPRPQWVYATVKRSFVKYCLDIVIHCYFGSATIFPFRNVALETH